MISVVLHAGPGQDDYTLTLANALSEIARVGLSISSQAMQRHGEALSGCLTPLVFNRPRQRHMWGFGEMWRQSRRIIAFHPDIFHLQNDGLWESVLLRMLGNLPVVNTIHDPIKHIDQRNPLSNAIMRDAVRHSRGWVVHSDKLKDIAEQVLHVDPARVLVHPQAILDYYTRFSSQSAPREKYILFFGRLRVNKGCDLLLKAFDSVYNQLDGWRVIVAGDGDGLKDAGAVIARLADRLDFRHRFIPDTEVADLFAHAGIVALPYRHGSHSAVLAVAAAFGCPVLATRMGNLPELVRDRQHVLFAEPEDEYSLAQGLLELAKDDALRAELGANLRGLARTAWSARTIAQTSRRFYEYILPLKG